MLAFVFFFAVLYKTVGYYRELLSCSSRLNYLPIMGIKLFSKPIPDLCYVCFSTITYFFRFFGIANSG